MCFCLLLRTWGRRRGQGRRKQDMAKWPGPCCVGFLLHPRTLRGRAMQFLCISAGHAFFFSRTLTSTGLTLTLNSCYFLKFFFQRKKFFVLLLKYNLRKNEHLTYRLCIVEFTFIYEILSLPNCAFDLWDAVSFFPF